jgi:hypothetical protein
MPEPTYSDVHVQAALTAISVAYLQSEDHYIADKVFPVVPVVHQADKYFVYTKDDYFRDEAQLRADATESAGSGFNLKTQSYSAGVWALHKDIGDQTRRNADPAVDMDVASTKFVMQRMLIRRDRFFAATFMTNVWGTNVTGSSTGVPGGTTTTAFWDDDGNGDPFTDIAVGQTEILQNTGLEPNTLVLGFPVYQALRKHPLVIDRIKYTSPAYAGTITPQLLAEAFDVERVLVSKGVYNTAQQGATGSYSFIVGNNALLCHSARAPGLWTPSAGYTFAWQGFTGLNSMGVRILQIPMPWLGSSMVRTEAEMAFDMQIVGSDLGFFWGSIISGVV